MHGLPDAVISRYSNTYAKKSKRLGVRILPLGRLDMVVFIYSNILLSVSMINMTYVRVRCSHERPLGLFEVLTRNRQSAVGRGRRTLRARGTTTPNVYNTSSITTALYHGIGDTKMESYTYQNQNRNQNRIRILIRITLVVRDIGIFRLPRHKASPFPHFISTPLSR